MRVARFTIAAVAVLAMPCSASAAPVLNAPTAASLGDSRPLLSWTAGAGETVDAVAVATRPAVTPEGSFFDEARVSFGIPDESATSWQDTSRIPAGTYWWNVQWSTETPEYTSGYTAPASFTIPVRVRAVGVSIAQWSYAADTVRVAYTANVRRVTVVCSVYHGRRRIARRATVASYVLLGVRSSDTCEVNVGRAHGGKRLRLVGEVRGGGRVARTSRYFIGKR